MQRIEPKLIQMIGLRQCSSQESEEHCPANPEIKIKLPNPENGLLCL
jgi:hypothetical protein